MLLKRIEGKTLDQALNRVREECGEDALLVETKQTRTGFLVVAARGSSAMPPAPAARGAAPARPVRWTRGFEPLARKASDFGLSDRVLKAVENALIGSRVELRVAGDPALPRLCHRILAALIRIERGIEERPEAGASVQVFVGPTGVGKTTTLAKLAARAVDAGQDAAIVTLDTYRVAAVEQLRAFADLLDLPFEVAFTPQDLRRAVQVHGHRDRILVDTTGRSPRDADALRVLQGTIGRNASVLLCLSAATRRSDCDVILDAYDRLAPRAAVLTKWDETVMPGEALSALVERGLSLSHVTIGQEVPADIVAADAGRLAAAALDLERELEEVLS
ncbi:MAG: hypothetical protein Fur0037_14060 [Planctomycetota bacterium]